MKNKFLEDSNGNKSSKRLWGTIFGVITATMGLILFTVSFFCVIKDSATAMKVFEISGLITGSLLGVGVLEKVFNRR